VFWGVTCRDERCAAGNQFAGDAVRLLADRNVSTASNSLPTTQKLRSREAGDCHSTRECDRHFRQYVSRPCWWQSSDHNVHCSVSTSDFLPLRGGGGGGGRKKKRRVLLFCPKIFERDLWLSLRSLCRYVISGFIRGISEISALLGCYANGSYLPTFRDNLSVPSSRVKQSNVRN